MRLRVFVAAGASAALATAMGLAAAAPQAGASAPKPKPSCAGVHLMCTEVQDSEEVFGEGVYVGHDEPSLLFYSNKAGSGNQMQYQFQIPTDPGPANPLQKSYNFEHFIALWFGVAMCDTQSYPEQKSTCTPDSDSNITPLAQHAGTAFEELQFYPPGYVQQFDGMSCSATQWCAALTIDSLSENPLTGQLLNTTCQNQIVGGLEYVNFAYLTKNGKPQGPPNPLQFDPVASGKPNPSKVAFFSPGDKLTVTLHDTAHGLQTTVVDHTSGVSGSMTASAANGFGQIKFAPTGTSCTEIPYDFHPMYSTSSPQTRVPWAAHSYNVAFDTEIGHWDWCTGVNTSTFGCTGLEGAPGDREASDVDDIGCFPPSASTLVKLGGCLGSNDPGFDGGSYLPTWPNGTSSSRPGPVYFTSPTTGSNYTTNYSRMGFETDTPRIEDPSLGGSCDRTTGAGCTLVPPTDDGAPAAFYPYYSSGTAFNGTCAWTVGQDVSGFTTSDYGKVSQYGSLLSLKYLLLGGHGATTQRFNDYRSVVSNPCPAS